MGIGRKVAIGVGGLLGLLVVGGGGVYLWASSAAVTKLAATHDVHQVDFPIPFPLTDAELATLRAERGAIASQNAATRGKDPLPVST